MISLELASRGLPGPIGHSAIAILLSPPWHDLAQACDDFASEAPGCNGCPVWPVYTCCCQINLGRPEQLGRGLWANIAGGP